MMRRLCAQFLLLLLLLLMMMMMMAAVAPTQQRQRFYCCYHVVSACISSPQVNLHHSHTSPCHALVTRGRERTCRLLGSVRLLRSSTARSSGAGAPASPRLRPQG
jgi:hypothetical protein